MIRPDIHARFQAVLARAMAAPLPMDAMAAVPRNQLGAVWNPKGLSLDELAERQRRTVAKATATKRRRKRK